MLVNAEKEHKIVDNQLVIGCRSIKIIRVKINLERSNIAD